MRILKILREKKKMTQEDLAKILHIDRSTVARWETTDAFPRADKIRQIASVFGCKIDFLFKSIDEIPRKKSS